MIAQSGPLPDKNPTEPAKGSQRRFGIKRPSQTNWLPIVLILVSLLVLAACGGESLATAEPTTPPEVSGSTPAKATSDKITSDPATPLTQVTPATASPDPASPNPVRIPQTTAGVPKNISTPEVSVISPTEATRNTPVKASEPPTLRVLSPQDGTGVEVAALKVMGSTSGKFIQINNLPIRVDPQGNFQHDLPLQQGVNLIEVEASDEFGQTSSQQLVVFSVEPTAGLPLTLLYPVDGLEVAEPSVPIVGLSALDAVVGINEIPTEVNELGIFSTSVNLEEGPNLIEVVAADLGGNVRFQTVVVFYTP